MKKIVKLESEIVAIAQTKELEEAVAAEVNVETTEEEDSKKLKQLLAESKDKS